MTVKTWIMIIGAALILALSGGSLFLYSKLSALQAHADALQDIVLKSASDIQTMSKELGISQSSLLTSKQLSDKYRSELDAMEDKFKNMEKKYKLQLSSRDNTIVSLKGKIDGTKGETTVVITPGKTPDAPPTSIAYTWHDTLNRFKLDDPDILKPNNENFTYDLKLGITGYVFKDKSGNVQIRKVKVNELRADGDKYIPIPDSKVELVDSKFEYINETNLKSWTDIFELRPLVLFDSQLNPGIGVEVINLGRYFDWVNIGLLPQVSMHVSDGLTGLQQSSLGVGLSYSFIKPLFDSNIAIGVSVSTPFNNFGGKYIFAVEGIFYLIN